MKYLWRLYYFILSLVGRPDNTFGIGKTKTVLKLARCEGTKIVTIKTSNKLNFADFTGIPKVKR